MSSDADVRAIDLSEVPVISLPGGSWSRMLVQERSVSGNRSSLGYSRLEPGTVLAPVRHTTEEVAYVVCGRGELRLDGKTVPFRAGQALFIPAGVWHSVAVTGEEPVEMVFGFPHPDYPPTERRDS